MNTPAHTAVADKSGDSPANFTREDGLGMDWQRVNATIGAAEHGALGVWRELLLAASASQNAQFQADAPIERLVNERAQLVDKLILAAWEHFGLGSNKSLALIAVGGYGRGELHPESDIDLLILTQHDAKKLRDTIGEFLTFLWDLGLEIGHSTRTVRECRSAAKDDLTVATTLLESRLLSGADTLYAELANAIAPTDIWPARAFSKPN